MRSELQYRIALTLVPNIGDIHAKALINHFETAKAVFSASGKELDSLEGIGSIRTYSIKGFKDFKDFKRTEEEIKLI